MTVYISFDGIDDIECELIDGSLTDVKIGSFFVDLVRMQDAKFSDLSEKAQKEAQRLLEDEISEEMVERYLSEKSA